MVIHRGWARDKLTVSDIVRDKIVNAPVFALHRLDRGTSGVVGFALDKELAAQFQELLQSSKVFKEYIALVRGPLKERLLLEHAIPKEKGGVRVNAITEFFPLCRSGRWSLVKAVPKTGRPHQLRRHLKHLSLPIIGDTKYGKGEINRLFREDYGLCRLALHATKLEFNHPETKEPIKIESKPSGELLTVIETLFGVQEFDTK